MSKTALLAAGAYAAGKNKENTSKERPSTLEQSVAMKPIAWLLIAGAVGFIVYKSGKGVSEAFKKWQANRDLEKEKNQLEKNQKLTYPITQYKIFADNIFDAFVGSLIDPTDEQRIRTVMSKMKNNLDVLKLIEVYGTRDGGITWWTPKMTLIEQIPYDMNDADIETYVNKPLRANGVTYQF